jgi:hypothetical protein
MASVNIQFREDDETIAFLSELGLKASEVAKAAFEREIRRLRAKALADMLRTYNVKLAPGEAAKVIREMRDSR